MCTGEVYFVAWVRCVEWCACQHYSLHVIIEWYKIRIVKNSIVIICTIYIHFNAFVSLVETILRLPRCLVACAAFVYGNPVVFSLSKNCTLSCSVYFFRFFSSCRPHTRDPSSEKQKNRGLSTVAWQPLAATAVVAHLRANATLKSPDRTVTAVVATRRASYVPILAWDPF